MNDPLAVFVTDPLVLDIETILEEVGGFTLVEVDIMVFFGGNIVIGSALFVEFNNWNWLG